MVAERPQKSRTVADDKMERLQRLGMSPGEAAKVAGIGRTLLRREIRNKRLVARKIGRRTVITADDLAAWLKGLPKAGEVAGR
jgi:excisionase family DNA binding protein